jgi:hypothetical protein
MSVQHPPGEGIPLTLEGCRVEGLVFILWHDLYQRTIARPSDLSLTKDSLGPHIQPEVMADMPRKTEKIDRDFRFILLFVVLWEALWHSGWFWFQAHSPQAGQQCALVPARAGFVKVLVVKASRRSCDITYHSTRRPKKVTTRFPV